MWAPCSASMCCWGGLPRLHHGGAGHQPQTRPQAGLDPVRRHAGPISPPMAFFDKVPQGASSTTSTGISRGGPGGAAVPLMGLFGMLVSVLLQVVVIGINIPLLLLIALVGWALYVLQRRYRAVQLQLRRPVLSAAFPALHQHQRDHPRCPALRLAGARHFALDQVLHHYDNNLRSWYTTTSINRWLGMPDPALRRPGWGRVALIVAFGNSPLLGAVAITYAFTASAMLNSLIHCLRRGGTGDERSGQVREYSG